MASVLRTTTPVLPPRQYRDAGLHSSPALSGRQFTGEPLVWPGYPNGKPPTVVRPTQTSARAINKAAKTIEASAKSIAGTDKILPVLYGSPLLVGGLIAGLVADQARLHFLLVLGYGQVASIGKVWNGSTEVTHPNMRIAKYYGTPTQTVDPALVYAYSLYGKTFTDAMPGVAYVVVGIPPGYDLSSLPNFAVECGGMLVTDFRVGGAKVATGNPVLCLADFITSSEYGLGRTYNVASFTAAANYCDEAAGGESRYRMALALTESQKVADWLAAIEAYTGSILTRRAGVYYLTPLQPRATSIVVDKARILQDTFTLALKPQRDLPTKLTVNYTDWRAFPPSTRQAVQVLPVNSDARESSLSLPGFTSFDMASRYAGRRLNALWFGQLSAQWKAFDEAINYARGDVLSLSFPEYGLSGALFWITGLTDQGFGRWQVDAETYDADAFTDVPQAPPPVVDSGGMVPDAPTVPVLIGPITITEELVEYGNGDFRPRIRGTWPDVADLQTAYYSCALLDVTDPARPYTVTTMNIPISTFISLPVVEDRIYRLLVSEVGVNGLSSPILTSPDILTLGKTAPPSDVTGFSAIEAGGNVFTSWNPIPDLDRDEYEIRRGPVGTAWSAMVPISRLHSTNTVLNSQPVGKQDYAIKAKDTSGTYSAHEARVTVDVTADQNLNLTGPFPFVPYATSNVQSWLPYGGSVVQMVNTDLAGLWADGATDPNNNTGTFNDVLKDVIIASPNAVPAFIEAGPYDFGVIVTGRISTVNNYSVLTGPAAGVTLSWTTSTDGVTYAPYTAGVVQPIRYVKCKLSIAANTVIKSQQDWTVAIVAVLLTEQGTVTVFPSGKATVTLANKYAAWVAIQVTPQGNASSQLTGVYDNVQISATLPNTFDVYLFKGGVASAGTASWSFRGVR
jgi:hypothetical protein